MENLYTYNCRIARIVDGDTVDVDIYLGFDVVLANQRVRLYGVDAPESRTLNRNQKVFGLFVKYIVMRRLEIGRKYFLLSEKFDAKGKFGRILGDFSISPGITLANNLLESGLAVPYLDSSEERDKLHIANLRELNTPNSKDTQLVAMVKNQFELFKQSHTAMGVYK